MTLNIVLDLVNQLIFVNLIIIAHVLFIVLVSVSLLVVVVVVFFIICAVHVQLILAK